MINKIKLSAEISAILQNKKVIIPESRQHLLELAMGGQKECFEVGYKVETSGEYIVEANVVKCKNGLSINYTDLAMRRRDPDCMVIGDDKDTDKPTYFERFKGDFEPIRQKSFDWLKEQDELIVMPFWSGGKKLGYHSLLIAPANSAFFAGGLADLQEFIPANEIPADFSPKAIIYLIPPFRHIYFEKKQVVVHNRRDDFHELFSFNLYPGPSAKKGVYGILLSIGELEGWVTLHGASVKLITPYDNELIILHEGASGSGKSEMIGEMHREPDGRILVCENTLTKEKHFMTMPDTCELHPITDDMALCHPSLQQDHKKLVLTDAEAGWFLRVDHIKHYGTEPSLERLVIEPKEPLIMLNMDGKAGSTCLPWEHIEDKPGKPCSNPRIILPRHFVPNTIDEPVEIDVRSFGVRCPPSTKGTPNYGVVGLLQILPPALAWLWRLVAPRGHANPSIISAEGLSSEGVGSYWPFATGKMVTQANLMLEQIKGTPYTRNILIPNQYIGAYKVGFMTEWISREFLARRGSVKFKDSQIIPARCPLFGYSPTSIKISGADVPKFLLHPEEQLELGVEAYDKGAEMLWQFFCETLQQFNTPELDETGRKIIEVCLRKGTLAEYEALL